MKFLVVIFVITIAGISAMPEDKFKYAEVYVKACAEENGVEPELAKHLKDGKISSRDEKTRCFIKCAFTKFGLMDEEGKLQKEGFLSKWSEKDGPSKPENHEELINKCVTPEASSENKCDTAFNFYECYWENRNATQDLKVPVKVVTA